MGEAVKKSDYAFFRLSAIRKTMPLKTRMKPLASIVLVFYCRCDPHSPPNIEGFLRVAIHRSPIFVFIDIIFNI